MQDGKFRFINTSAIAYAGYTAEELIGRDSDIIVHSEDKEMVKRMAQEVLSGARNAAFEFRMVTKQNQIRWISQTVTPIQHGGRPAILGNAIDVTEIKQAEAERARAEELYRILAESSLAGVYVVQDGNFRFINSNAASYAGYMREELVNHEVGQLVHPDDREMVRMNAWAMLRGERTSPYEFRIITKHGEIRWIMETVASISYEGRLAVLGNSMDVTDRKKASSQLLQSEKMASIGQLAAGVAHEINNPTAFVSSNLKTLSDYMNDVIKLIGEYRTLAGDLKKEATGEESYEMVAERLKLIEGLEAKMDVDFIIKDAVDLIGESKEGTVRIGRIVQDLKNFAHPGDEKLRTVKLNDSIESTLNIVWNELKYKAVVRKEYGDIPDILGYPQQLNQVFMNLLVNAAQAIKEKGEICIATKTVDGHAEITIADTGVGIPAENLRKIFDPFFTTKDVGKGTGLGLHVAYSIIEKHRGTIEVDSTVDKGTTFTVKIPLRHE